MEQPAPIEEIPRLHPDAECEKCPLRTAGSFVPSDGPKRAKVAFVGEAAGQNEVQLGRPFVGVSGKLLDKVLNYHGIKRNEVFLTNATLCRPKGKENTVPPATAISACRPRLVKELKDHGVETVVTLGNTASQSLLATRLGVTQLRVGFGHESPVLPGVKVLPTFHPAACLRSADFFPSLVKDVGKINSKPSAWNEPVYKVFDEPEEAIAVLNELRQRTELDKLVVDIECDIEKDVSFDHPSRYGMLCVGICYAKGKVVIIERNALKDGNVKDALLRLLKVKKLIGQHFKFDIEGLWGLLGVVLEAFADIMIANYVQDERPGIHSLEAQSVELLGHPSWKSVLDPWNPKKNGYGIVPPDVLDQYNAYDCAETWDLWELHEVELARKGLRELHDFLIRAANQLVYTELNGIAIDVKHNDQLAVTYLQELYEVEVSLQTIINNALGPLAFPALNPRSPIQVKKVLELFDVRVASTDEATLTFLLDRQDDPTAPLADFCRTLLEHRGKTKLYGTYVKGIRKRMYRGRVYPTFLLHRTNTGRLSCRNPNLQNIPRQSIIRQQFVPSTPSRVFVNTDMSQAELRVLTWLAQEPYFREILNDPTRDLFDELTPVLYGNRVTSYDPAVRKELRIRVKAYVYGLSYGREAKSIAAEFNIKVSEAEQGMQAFFDVIPNIVEYRASVRRDIKAGKDLTTPFGRHRRFWLITAHNFEECFREGLAFRPQSTSSDICLQAFTWARPKLKGVAWLRNIVHDSILAECEPENAEYVGQTLNDLMIESARTVVGDYVRFATETKIGKAWSEV